MVPPGSALPPPRGARPFTTLPPLVPPSLRRRYLAARRAALPAVARALYGPAMAEGERAESSGGPGPGPGPGRPPSPAELERAEALKTRANEFFKGKDYENAVKYYSSAIELNPTNAIYYGNRSLAYLRTECYGYALADATRAVELDKKYIKGYYRRAASNMALGKFKAALRDYETVVKVRPNDKDAKLKYQEGHKSRQSREKAFEAGDASDGAQRSVVDSLDIESMSETEYSGPKLDGGKVTLALMKELIAVALQGAEERTLHRKMAGQAPTLVETTLRRGVPSTVTKDLAKHLQPNGLPSESNPYIFNGDFVDRGSFSVEVILNAIRRFKLLYPEHFHLLRVMEHETDNMNQIYGFRGGGEGQVHKRSVCSLQRGSLSGLPLDQCINASIMHGGLFSEDGVTLMTSGRSRGTGQPPGSGGDGPWRCPLPLLWNPQPSRGDLMSPLAADEGTLTHLSGFLQQVPCVTCSGPPQTRSPGELLLCRYVNVLRYSAIILCSTESQTGSLGGCMTLKDLQYRVKKAQML
uniref:protein-serine/threonine phosphatase n=1 Tax=Aquila chrysaetos chrysaetos TaxID=223781 RepID=A0A663F0N8_AQUCH